MKIFMLYTGGGPLVIMTSHKKVDDPVLLGKLNGKGITKFIAYEISQKLARERYGRHYDMVLQNLDESDDLRVLDYNGHHVMSLFNFDEMGQPVYFEKP